MKQHCSRDIILDEPGERADANQIIVDQPLRDTDDKNQMRALFVFAKRNAGAAAPDAQDNLID